MGTRKEKYKRDAALKRRSEKDPSTQAIELKRKLEKARESAFVDAVLPIACMKCRTYVGEQ